MRTWGNTKIVGREPHLAALGGNFRGEEHPNWENQKRHGGAKGQTFMDYTMELVPECVVIESEPTGYPRAPVGKKKIWVDTRNAMVIAYITYDRRGNIWKQVDPAFGPQVQGKFVNKDETGHPHWSWTSVHIHDIQSNRMSLLNHVKQISGGYSSNYYNPDENAVYEKFLTQAAIARLGTV